MKTILMILMLFCISTISVIAQYNRWQEIVAAEYFVNTDPGEGNGTEIIGTYNLWEVSINVNGLNIPVGSRIYIRFKSSNNTWSAPRSIEVPKDYFTNSGANLVYGEYFINTDPGQGNGTPVTIEPDGKINLYNLPLKRGDKVYFRVKDSFNRWSPARPVTFRFKDITKAEYYIKRSVGGITTPVTPMIVSSVNDSSAIFIAHKDSVPARTNDTIYVCFQTDDHFLSKWYSIVVVTGPYEVKDAGTSNFPTQYGLSQNYPNPFNPVTTISYQLPKQSYVILKVFDILGREIATLVNGIEEAGYKSVKFNANGLPSGVYYYCLKAHSLNDSKSKVFIDTKKLVLLR